MKHFLVFKGENLSKVRTDSDKTYSLPGSIMVTVSGTPYFSIYTFTVKVDQPLRRSALQEGEDAFTQSME